MNFGNEFEIPLVNYPRAVNGIPFVYAQTKIEEAYHIKRDIEDYEILTTRTNRNMPKEEWSNDISIAKRYNVGAPVRIAPKHPIDGTGTTLREVAESVRDLDATAGEVHIKYMASGVPVTDTMVKMADGALDGIEKVNVAQSADASKHITAIKQNMPACSVANIFAPALIDAGLIGKELKGHIRSALVAHCIGPDGSYCWRDFSDGSALPVIAEALVGKRPDMDLATAACYVAPLQYNKDRFKLQGCYWWCQGHRQYMAV